MTPDADRSGDALRKKATGAVQSLASPVVGYFDHRFQDLFDRLDDRMGQVYERVATEVEIISELTINMQRFVDVSGQELRDVVAELRTLVSTLEGLVERLAPAEADAPVASAPAAPDAPPAEG